MTFDRDDRESVDTALIPARILNEHVYCPRLAWLEWEAKAFVENADTAEGSDTHRRVDKERGALPSAAGSTSSETVATSVNLSSARLGLIAKLDKVELGDGQAIPVETKKGKPKEGKIPVWEPELAQLTAQALLLRDQGYEVPRAEVFFAETRTRKEIEIPGNAEEWISGLVAEIRANASQPTPPPPLIDSPKCGRCSLVTVCLPDETNLLRAGEGTTPRRLIAADSPAKPLYVTTPGAFLRKKSKRLILEHDGEELGTRRMIDISHIAVFGNVTVGAAVMRACLDEDIPILWLTHGGWFSGYSIPHGGSWVARRQLQYAVAAAPDRAVPFAAAFVSGKIRNQRTLLRRLSSADTDPTLDQLKSLVAQADDCEQVATLLGIEGAAARLYFQSLPSMLNAVKDDFDFNGRNRRPPRDPVNAMLSFTYALLLRDTTVAAIAAGLDPQVGLLHQPHFGRPSLALDLAEEFRPLIADSAVIMAINNGEVREGHFVRRADAVSLNKGGRTAMIKAYERRVAVKLTHPLFGYKTTYRRAMELQARQLASALEGDLDRYRPVVTR